MGTEASARLGTSLVATAGPALELPKKTVKTSQSFENLGAHSFAGWAVVALDALDRGDQPAAERVVTVERRQRHPQRLKTALAAAGGWGGVLGN